MMSSFRQPVDRSFALRLENLEAAVRQQWTTVEALRKDGHEYADANRQLQFMMQLEF